MAAPVRSIAFGRFGMDITADAYLAALQSD